MEILHNLFDCAALSEERRKLNDKTGQLCPSFPALINEIAKNRYIAVVCQAIGEAIFLRVPIALGFSMLTDCAKPEDRIFEDCVNIPRVKPLVWSSMENAGFNYSVAIEYFKHPLISLGMMDTTCRFCGALR
ncbi:hypothetical protein LAZ67_5001957 [Cordylochernes scorpioides]|uniref:Uncharacterized protein n=1 Tax=Cordylochernes scorpioides TaxID=51811 RepID=A0ABY6KGA3_9ARAC|nr:hypothetical protein LAZ67_5001957 [Cordylochernes scorpioides]